MTDFVLVPGAGGDSTAWHRVIAILEDGGDRAVAVTLPAADPEAGITEYAEAVISAAADLDDVVLVAHSMGAYAAVVAAEHIDAKALIFVAAMIPSAGESPGEWWTQSGQAVAQRELDVAEGRDPDQFDEQESFWNDVPTEVLADFTSRPQQQAQRPFDDSWTATRWRSMPISVVAAEHDRLFPLHFMQKLSRERLGVEPALVPGGHWPALASPQELARLLIQCAAHPLSRNPEGHGVE